MIKKITDEELMSIISKEELYNLYVIQNIPFEKLYKQLNIARKTLIYLLKLYNINKSNFIYVSISKEKLHELYIEKNLSSTEIARIYKCRDSSILRKLKNYGIKKDKKSIQEKRRLNCIKTCLDKYNVINVFQTENTKNKIKNTCLNKYNVEHISQSDSIKNKAKQTCLHKYGVEYATQSNIIKEKIRQTNLERYGVKSVTESKEVQDKMHNTMLERYGVINPSQSKEIQQRKYITQYKNNSFNTSKPEEQMAALLLTKFPDTIRQYKSESYPFICDFYIPSLDLYIEYQGTWTHGKEPFDFYNPEHLIILEKWKEKATLSRFYKGAVNVWTKRDPLKRETAKKNNLNWIEFFNMEQFFAWYKTQKGLPLLEYKSSIK